MDSAVAEVFEQMLQRGCVSVAEPSALEVAISARVRLSGVLEAQCILEFPSASAQRLTDAFLGAGETEWEESMLADTVGELCNMIAGGWKTRLGQSAWGADLSVPLLSRGSDKCSSAAHAATSRKVYTFDDSPFMVCLIVF